MTVSARIVLLQIDRNPMAASASLLVRDLSIQSTSYLIMAFCGSACHRCRAKRGRCTGEKPVCAPCVKAQAECTWPEGRRKKRTRREMEADERAAREAATMGVHRTTATFPMSSRPQPYPAQIQHPSYSDHSASPQEHNVSPVLPSPAHWVRLINKYVAKSS